MKMKSNTPIGLFILSSFIVSSIQSGSSSKILIVNPIGSKSLYYLSKSLGYALGDAGHSVTIINSFSNSSGHPRVKDVHTGVVTKLLDQVNVFEIQGVIKMFRWLKQVTKAVGSAMWLNPEIVSLWQDRNSFDAIVMIGYANEIGVPFLMDFHGPHISFCTPGVEYNQISNYGHWLPLSVVPLLVLPYDENMSFLERSVNLAAEFLTMRFYYWSVYPYIQELLEEHFPDIGPYDVLYLNSSLLLINGHFALDSPLPLLPNQIEIGTINANEPQQLPKDLLDFIEGSGEEGIIYFNLGSIVRGKDIPTEHKQTFINVFSKLPQRVLWKYEENDLKLPPNVMTRKWLPQQDVLGHPKTRVFMSHCGNLGTQEAKYHGVPILAMPVAFDQHRNAARLTKQGFGLGLDWDDLTEETLFESLNTLLNDTKYERRLKQVSRILHDQKESPGERAVWWIEYIIRHNGAPHMTYAGKRLHFLQYIMVDVLAFYLLFFSVFFYLFYIIFSIFFKKCFSDKKKKD